MLGRTLVASLIGGAALTLGASAWAHSGLPAEAIILDPEELGTVVTESFTFRWLDQDTPTPTGSATVTFYYSQIMPPTYVTQPDERIAEGTLIHSVLEDDTSNTFTWDVRDVTPGTYWIWSRVFEPDGNDSISIIHYSPAPIHVVRDGETPGPALLVKEPDSPFSWSDDRFTIEVETFDPDGTARVKVEAADTFDGSRFFTLVDGLSTSRDPVTLRGTGIYTWDTSQLHDGDWTVRATVSDCQGQSFTSYARFFLFVTHPRGDAGIIDTGPLFPDSGEADGWVPLWCVDGGLPPTPDATPLADAGEDLDAAASEMRDAGPPDRGAPDAALPEPEPEPEGCGCRASGDASSMWLWLGLLPLALRRRYS